MTNAYAVLPSQESLKSMILQQDPSLSGDAFLAEYNAKGSAQNIPMPSPVNEALLASADTFTIAWWDANGGVHPIA